MKTTIMAALMTAALASGLVAANAEETWVPLFDGKSIDGFVQRGGKAVYRVEDGCIVGKTVKGTPNSFLCTPRDYGNFILEYEFKVNPKLNSGVQIRSEMFDEAKVVKNGEKEIKVAAGRVHGYQIEIDNDPKKARFWTAGLYEEGCRGWIFPGFGGGEAKAFTAQGKDATKVEDWNQVRIECKGDSIKTFLNGQPRVDAKDGRTAKGFIAFQVHSAGEADMEVRWRSVRIQELK